MQPLDDFIAQYRGADDELWLAGLTSGGYTRLDWPSELGGPGLSREQKLITINRLIEAGCPLFPEAITVLAPLVTNLIDKSDPSAEDEARAMLDQIATKPAAWRHVIVDDTLLVEGPGVSQQFGDTGQAPLLLASNASPLFCLYEIKLTLSLICSLHVDPDEATDQAISDLAVTLAALEGQYLTEQPRDDLQIALAVHRERLNGYSLLFQSLGYYALLDPDNNLSGNEPVPYVRERAHLKSLRQSQDRDTVLQQDLVYEALLESMTT